MGVLVVRMAASKFELHTPFLKIGSYALRGRVAIHARDWVSVPTEDGENGQHIAASAASPGANRNFGIGAKSLSQARVIPCQKIVGRCFAVLMLRTSSCS